MSKLKTRKAMAKRFKTTKSGKVLVRKSGQGHYNAKETGNKTRKKRKDIVLSKTTYKNVKLA